MADPHPIAVIVGSLRKGSYNRLVAQALIQLAQPALQLRLLEIGKLPLYNQDLEGGDLTPPQPWTDFREALRPMHGVIFVTPEYNRGVPAALKNAIDVGSRPYGAAAWTGKPAAIISASPGAMGGFGANHQLRQSLVFLDMPPLQQPECYLSHIDKAFGPDGQLGDERLRGLLQKLLRTFEHWVECHHGH
ncbi:NADPH-dependent FMN reductase [Azohydromonas caseinilytica]|uniref:NAD(P)H-dependent oxidoreductase n=1 Tax=Azohydromonas caseinilytica TaxID=2728836 RepID=A0A848F5B7_9BURK|nr:NAD(P)H-dependent oxidoreductase [Azohydromonas caseinilytica]NML13563.1 NAD(P)H-dependent oxidoreductase [Azohydromonas caseinilytica]